MKSWLRIYWPLLPIAAVLVSILVAFVVEQGRLPYGSGEVWNWILGLGDAP